MQSEAVRQRDWRVWLLVLLVMLPAVTTYVILWRNTLNIPFMDDYDAILDFANKYQQLSSVPAKLLYINDAVHVQYKLIALHTVVALDLALQRHIDFVVIQWLGNVSLLLIAFGLWLMLPAGTMLRRLLYFLPVSCLVFMMRDSEALDWAMDCLQLVAVAGYTLLALYLFCGWQRTWFAGACVAFALATWSSANGLLVLPLALLILWQRRNWKRIVALLGVAAVVLLSYFHGYHMDLPVPDGQPASPVTIPVFFLALLGNLFSRLLPASIFGLILLSAVAVPLWRALTGERRLDAVTASILFLLLNAGLITVGRYRMGLVGAVSSRYSIYSQILAALVCILLLRGVRPGTTGDVERPALPTRYWALAAFAVVMFVHYERIGARLMRGRTALSLERMAAWEHYGPKSSLIAYDDAVIQKNWAPRIPHNSQVLAESIRQRIYVPPPLPRPVAPPKYFQQY